MDNDTVGLELRKRAHQLCSEHLGGVWSKISNSEINVTQISGGASNLLYCCQLPKDIVVANGVPTQILIRFYGDQSKLDEIAIQCEIFDLLSRKSLGPKLYGTFDEGRLEEFLPANSLTCNEIRDLNISRIISEKLAVVHSLNVPINKDESWLIERLQEWTDNISNDIESIAFVEHSNDWHSTREIARELLAINFEQEIQFIKDEIFDKSTSIKVFSHNDLHQGNILFAEPSKQRPSLRERIVFIDFEYCSYNYRAYDIANHLCEWLFQYGDQEYPHFTCYQEKFPTRDEQLNFIHHYLSEIARLQNTDTQTKIELTYGDRKRLSTLDKHEQEQQQQQQQQESTNCLEFDEELDEVDEQVAVEEAEDEQEEEEVVEKEEEAEYDDDYILCNDRREITGNIQPTLNIKNKEELFANLNTNGHSTVIDKITDISKDQSSQPQNALSKINNSKSSFNNNNNISNNNSNTKNNNNVDDKQLVLISEDEEEKLFQEIQPFYMAVSLFWTMWCIKQAQTSTIKFGYWEHAMNRWNLYTQFKSNHLKAMSDKDPRS